MRPAQLSLYERVMGDRFRALPPAVRALHELHGEAIAIGDGSVITGGGLAGLLIRKVMGFPPAGQYAVEVRFAVQHGVETWSRRFGDYGFRSRLAAKAGGLTERFGLLRFSFDLPSDARGLCMVLTGWDFAGLPLPRFLAPRIHAAEWEEGGWFRFDVAVALPLVGPVIRYSGRLRPESER